jgi:hypothetical protein
LCRYASITSPANTTIMPATEAANHVAGSRSHAALTERAGC